MVPSNGSSHLHQGTRAPRLSNETVNGVAHNHRPHNPSAKSAFRDVIKAAAIVCGLILGLRLLPVIERTFEW